MEKSKMNLYQKLVEIRKQVLYVQKDSKGFGAITYASGADIICAIRPKQDELNVILKQDVLALEFVSLQKGATTISVPKIEVTHTWFDGDNPSDQLVTHDYYFEDKMTGSQCIGAMKTYAERYFLYKFFQVATGADDIEKVYKDNGWSNKVDEPKIDPIRTKAPVLVDAPKNLAVANPGAKVNRHNIVEASAFCRMHLGAVAQEVDVVNFITQWSTFYKDSLAELDKKVEKWKENPETLKSEFAKFMAKHGQAPQSAPTQPTTIA